MAGRADSPPHHRVVIVGGGFGGLYCAKALRRAPVDVTLIDRRNFHLFQPLLYQVATGGLSPANIAYPLRAALKRNRRTRVLMAEVVDFDLAARRVLLREGQVDYDTLVVAGGATNHYFGNEHWAETAPGLKTIEDATHMRSRILSAFEIAEREPDPARQRAWLTFVVIGGGPTGVELAGALAEIARDTLRHEFRRIDPGAARILLVEGQSRILTAYPPHLSERAAQSLRRLGVCVRLGAMVHDIRSDHVVLRAGEAIERIDTHTVLWAAGVRAAPLAEALAKAAGAAQDRLGRLIAEPNCTLAHHPNVFVIGDMARCDAADGQPLPGVAPVAMQQGAFVAQVIRARLDRAGDSATADSAARFRYRDRGSMATIGRAAAVADLGWVRFSGYAAWLAWLLLHVAFLIEYQNRVLVLLQWAWNYFTWGRSARLIVDRPDSTAGGAD